MSCGFPDDSSAQCQGAVTAQPGCGLLMALSAPGIV